MFYGKSEKKVDSTCAKIILKMDKIRAEIIQSSCLPTFERLNYNPL
jgi:hypothetical protein